MHAKPLQLIVCDNDGCLMPEQPGILDANHFSPISEHNRRAMTPGSNIPPLTVATGRPVPFVELLLRMIQCRDVPAICEHGALTYCLSDNTARRDPLLTPDVRASMVALRQQILTEHPDWIIEAGKEAMVSIYVPEGGSAVDDRISVVHAMLDQMQLPLKVSRTVTYINVTFAKIDKGHALRQILNERQIDPAAVLAIGDTSGDLPLRDVCSLFACPANATDEVKAAADYVSPFETMQGVIDIIDHFAR